MRFEAAAGSRTIRLEVRVSGEAISAAAATTSATGAAIALGDCDDLLQAIDGWLSDELDWRWITAGVEPGAEPANERGDERGSERGDKRGSGRSDEPVASADCAVGGEPAEGGRCRLEVPWALMRMSGPPPAGLAGRLRWQDARALLSISRLSLAYAELSDLEEGGALILPESMGSDWTGWLHVLGVAPEEGLAVDLAAPGGPRVAAGAVGAAGAAGAGRTGAPFVPAEGAAACEVRLASTAPLPAAVLAGWPDTDGSLAAAAGAAVELWLSSPSDSGRRTPYATGRLIPWGTGWAMLVDEIRKGRIAA
jgi:hypothetical protein